VRVDLRHLESLGDIELAPELREGVVNVWCYRLPEAETEVGRIQSYLSDVERQRASRLRQGRVRDEFILGRGALRSLLAKYLHEKPEKIPLSTSVNGKPYVDPIAGSSALSFNISHSDGVAVFAFALKSDVGIDIERIRPDVTEIMAAASLLSQYEQEILRGLSQEGLVDAFFRCWTRKEAYVKGRGDGLALPLQDFDVSLLPNEPARLLATRPDSGDASRWELADLAAFTGYASALAVSQ
jgi:4'-phosphopantetheinyl transferase